MKLRVVKTGTEEYAVVRKRASDWIPISELFHETEAKAQYELTQFVLRDARFNETICEVDSNDFKRNESNIPGPVPSSAGRSGSTKNRG